MLKSRAIMFLFLTTTLQCLDMFVWLLNNSFYFNYIYGTLPSIPNAEHIQFDLSFAIKTFTNHIGKVYHFGYHLVIAIIYLTLWTSYFPNQ